MKNKIFHLLPLFAVIAILTTVAFFLFSFSIHKEYYPVTFSIEMKSPTDNVCQLFYSSATGFREDNSIKKNNQGGDFFKEIYFELPPVPINYLRFDPGDKSGRFEVRKIEIRVGDQIKVYSGEELKAHFIFINLSIAESPTSEFVVLNSTYNHDSQIHLNRPLEKSFDLVESKDFTTTNYIIAALYLVLIIMVVMRRKRMSDLLVILIGLLRRISWPSSIEITPFSIAMAALFFAKLCLVSAQQMTCISTAGHDDALFVKLAYNISSGNWLGSYNNLTLIKGFFYPFFIAGTNALGMRLFFAENVLYALASFLLVLSLTPVIKNQVARILLFGVLLFNPMNSVYYLTRVLREDIYTSLSMITLAAFLSVFLSASEAGFHKVRVWSIIGGLSLFAFWNTREEGIVLLPVFLLLALFYLLKKYQLFRKSGDEGHTNSSVLNLKKSIFYALLPFVILLFGNYIVASVNYIYYGAFVINEMKSKPFSDAFAALSKIKQEKFIVNVPVSRESRIKAYTVSPGFAQLAEFLDSKDNKWVQSGHGSPEEIKGGWTVWALRDAADAKGYHSSLVESQKFYKQIADEINAAFEDGRLEKTTNISFFGFTWDQRYFEPFVEIFRQQFWVVTSFEGYSPYPEPLTEMNTADGITTFQYMTNEIACTKDMVNASLPSPTKLKYKLLILVGKIYQYSNPVIAMLSILSFVLIIILLLKIRNQKQLLDLVIIPSFLLYIVFSRHALIASGTVAQWTFIQAHYLNLIYPFMLLFEFIVIWGAWNYFSTLRRCRLKSISKNTN